MRAISINFITKRMRSIGKSPGDVMPAGRHRQVIPKSGWTMAPSGFGFMKALQIPVARVEPYKSASKSISKVSAAN